LAEVEALKAAAAARALELVRDGMLVGLGTGTTADHFIDGVGALVRQGLRLRCVPTSWATAARARRLGIPLTEEPAREIDLTVDGAGEIDPARNLNKGHGGALAREKLVALASRRYVVIADRSKLTDRLGRREVPVEVLPFMWRQTAQRLARLGAACCLRGGEADPFVTDNGNLVLNLVFPDGIEDPGPLGRELERVRGVVEHGLFTDLAHACVLAGEHGVDVLGSL
jgi:ribose 5-phosphate isomerase A